MSYGFIVMVWCRETGNVRLIGFVYSRSYRGSLVMDKKNTNISAASSSISFRSHDRAEKRKEVYLDLTFFSSAVLSCFSACNAGVGCSLE